MKANRASLWLAVVVMASTCVACGGQAEKSDPVGTWERRYQDAVGQKYLDVLELFENGTYIKHGVFPDSGSYIIEDDTIAFRSAVDQRFSRDVTFSLDKDTMKFRFTLLFPQEEDWVRSSLTRNFRTIDIDGRHVPRALPGVMMSALVSEARPWQEDALPTWIRLDEKPNGQYDVIFHFYSPSMVEEMRIRVSPYDIKKSTNDGSRTATAALPPNFMDLPQIIALAKDAGLRGKLWRADARVYDGFGAVWMLSTKADGASVSAETGAIIEEDVTGYIAQYNADWQRARELWRKARERARPRSSPFSTWDSSSSSDSYDSGSDDGSSSPSYDGGSQNSWSSGDWDAYNRFQNGTPNADDCYRYGC